MNDILEYNLLTWNPTLHAIWVQCLLIAADNSFIWRRLNATHFPGNVVSFCFSFVPLFDRDVQELRMQKLEQPGHWTKVDTKIISKMSFLLSLVNPSRFKWWLDWQMVIMSSSYVGNTRLRNGIIRKGDSFNSLLTFLISNGKWDWIV